jgi:aspartyl-tRNA(Asn)/glutamyl-tRNA(Gln) amidotransferase subunit B
MSIDYEIVVGLEVHVELATRSKIFCGCSTQFGAEPNTQVCPVCLGLPGTLPVLNREVLNLAIRAALALNCELAEHTKFDRKNYFYLDSPKAYQISQFDMPLAKNGYLDITSPNGAVRRIGITRVHMEEDAGKLLHAGQGGQIGNATSSLADYNRTGVPLIEIVSEPDLRTPEEAYLYLTGLKEILEFSKISDCNMEEGSLRCDANISVRPLGQAALGTKAELKNMNSFKNVRAGVEYEAKRQIRLLNEGGRVVQETRAWDAEKGVTRSMRSKEEAHDYRYFPEPDLPMILLTADMVETVRETLPELPQAKRVRFQTQYGLNEYDAGVLTATSELAEYFEAAAMGTNPKAVCNWLTVELLGRLNVEGKTIAESPVKPGQLNALVKLIESGELSGKLGKQVFAEMAEKGEAPQVVVKRLGLAQISDVDSLKKIVMDVLAANPGPVAEYRGGKAATLGFLVGQIMKVSRGQANPQKVNQLLREELEP